MSLGVMAWANRLTRFAVLGLFASLALSRSFFTLFAVLAVLAWLLSGDWSRRWQQLRCNLPALFMLGLAVVAFALAPGSSGGPAALPALKIYWQLLLVPVIATTMVRPGDIEQCWRAYALGMVVLLAHVLALTAFHLPWVSESAQTDRVFFNPLPQAVGLAVFSGGCLFWGLAPQTSRLFRLGLWLGFVAASLAVLVVSQQRLGFLAWAVMVVGAVAWRVPRHWRVRAVLAAMASTMLVLAANPQVRDRMALAVTEFQQHKGGNDYSSIGSRLQMWSVSADLIQQSPWLGHGPGSYSGLARQRFADETMCAVGCVHPHNQFLLIWVELGLPGLILLSGAVLAASLYHWRRPRFHPLAVPVLMVFVLASLVDTTLWYRGFLYLFVPLLGLVAIRQPSGDSPAPAVQAN